MKPSTGPHGAYGLVKRFIVNDKYIIIIYICTLKKINASIYSGHRTGKGVFIPILKKGNAKEYSNYHTIALILHTSEVMLKSSKLGLNSM